MKKRKIPHQKRNGDTSPPRRFSIGRIAYMAFLCPTVSLMFSQPAFAATDVWTKATEIMQDVYTQILAISTIAAIVTASVALLLMNFSRSGKTVDESRAWLKRIVITWAILNSLGFKQEETDHMPDSSAGRHICDPIRGRFPGAAVWQLCGMETGWQHPRRRNFSGDGITRFFYLSGLCISSALRSVRCPDLHRPIGNPTAHGHAHGLQRYPTITQRVELTGYHNTKF